jgi:hypothetical protein
MFWDRESLGIESFDDPLTLVEAGGAQKPESLPVQYVEARALEYDYHMGVKTFSSSCNVAASNLGGVLRSPCYSRQRPLGPSLMEFVAPTSSMAGAFDKEILRSPLLFVASSTLSPEDFLTKIFHVC